MAHTTSLWTISLLPKDQTFIFYLISSFLKSLALELLLEKVPQDLFHSVYFEYEENSTHDRLLSLNYAFCHIKRLIKTSEPVYTD